GRELLAGEIKTLDPVLLQYSEMAIGGEIRHHFSCHELNHVGRSTAWALWKHLADRVGPDIYRMAAEIFRNFEALGLEGYGGEPWAKAAEIVHARLTGKLSPELFIDRVMDLEHNGGCFLNKVHWGYTGREFQEVRY